MKKHILGENGIHYTLGKDGLYYPNLKLSEETDYPIGRYGHMRYEYLKGYRREEYKRLIINGRLNEHLHSIEEECYQMMELLTKQMQERHGVNEQLKAENQMKWVGMMNNIRHSAEEVVLKEIVYR